MSAPEAVADPVGAARVVAATATASPSDPPGDKGPATTSSAGLLPAGVAHERFIPISRFEIAEHLTKPGLWPTEEIERATRFFHYLSAWRHIVYNERLAKLEEAYLPFSPDNDVRSNRVLSPEQRQAQLQSLVKHTGRLLEQANFQKFEMTDVHDVLGHKSEYGLDLEVDLGDFEELQVYWRGATVIRKKKRSLKKLGLGSVEVEYPVFRRLFVLLKLKPAERRVREVILAEGCSEKKARGIVRAQRAMLPDEVTPDNVYIKLFKDIPRGDIEMVFPNTRVRFRPRDKLMFGATAGGGTVAGVVTTATKVMAATNPMTIGFAVVGLGGLLARQVTTFFNQRNRYMMVLAQNLYFHSLADNRGVLTLLANRAEEEDIKEEMLLYTVLAKESVAEAELGEVKSAIEAFLFNTFGVEVGFDVQDALSRLVTDGIVRRTPDGRLMAMTPAEGINHLDKLWDSYLDPKGKDRSLLTEPVSA